jgi:PAS domain S-box-containing protein
MSDINISTLLADEALKIVETMRDSFLLLDENLLVIFANTAFYSTFKVTQENTIGKRIYEVGNGQWNIPELKIFIEETLSKEKEFHDYKVKHEFPDIGVKVMLLNGRKVKHDQDITLLVVSDITERETANDEIAFCALLKSYESLEKIDKFMVEKDVKITLLKEEIANLEKTISDTLQSRREFYKSLSINNPTH